VRRFLLVMSILLIPSLVFGQAQTTGRVTGTVVDEEGNPVSGARVVFISSALQGERVLATSESGRFLAAILPVGPYSVEISAPSMQPVSFSFRLGVGETVPLDVTLKKGEAIVEEVTVFSTASALETTSLGENFDYGTQVEELPVQNRIIERVAELAPNITYGPTGNNRTGQNIAISGAPSFDTTVLLDGSEMSDPYYGSSPTLYLEDAIEEVQVLTSGVSARYGRFQGGVVNAISKSGGNTYSGILRAQFDKETWNSQTPFGEDQDDNLNEFYQFTIGGFILKDHLWWFGGITEIPDSATTTLTTQQDPVGSKPTTQEEQRWQIKLRGAITPDHVLEVNHFDYEQTRTDRAGLPAGNISALNGKREDPREINVATYQGVLTPNLFLDLQWTEKKVSIASGGDPAGNDPVFDSAVSAVFNNHWWDFSDPSVRDNETLGLNITQALSTANWGTHTLEYGAQLIKSTTGGENRQSPTGFNLLNYSFNTNPVNDPTDPGAPFYDRTEPDGRDVFNVTSYYTTGCGPTGTDVCQVNYRWKALPLGGGQDIDNLAIYVQETWEVNKWRFDAGLRWDSYEGSGPLATQDFDFDAIAPRVGVTYNIDQNWQVQATYGRYISRFNDGVFNEITGVSAAPRLEQLYFGPDCWANGSLNDPSVDPGGDGCDAADINAINRNEAWWIDYTDVVDPEQPSTFNDDNITAPYADNFDFSVKRALPRNSGAIVFTYTNREFNGMLDDYVGAVCDDYSYTYGGGQCSNTTDIFDPDGNLLTTVDSIIWANSDEAKRRYNAFTVVANWTPSAKWGIGGNYTYGLITGNYEGEGRNTPSSGSIIGNHERGLSNELAYPNGTLDEEIRHRARLWGQYRFNFDRAGSLVLGSVFSYQTGQVYDHLGSTNRNTNSVTDVDPTGPNCGGEDPTTWPGGCYTSQGSRFTGIYDGRGGYTFDDWWRIDLSARWNIQLWKNLNFWLKVDALNFTNESTLTTFQTTGSVDNTGTIPQWQPASSFGRVRNDLDYQVPRTWLFTVGLQF